jgi:hypothetical protein
LTGFGVAAAQQTGFIQIRAEPGIRVLLDGALIGVTERDAGGLVITDVAVGQRQLQFERDGFVPQRASGLIAAGAVLLIDVAPFERANGSVIIQCVPVNCVVDIPTLGLRNVTKGDEELMVSGVALGVHSGSLRTAGLLARRVPVSIEVCEHKDTVRVLGVLVGPEPSVTIMSTFGFREGCAPPLERQQGSVAAGDAHSLAVREDGTLWAWGRNWAGQLGDGTTTRRSTPVQVLTNVRSVTAGGYHSLAVREDGTLWAWGWNGVGQLGDGTTENRSTPVQVLTNVRTTP